jgi:hypothetical protein
MLRHVVNVFELSPSLARSRDPYSKSSTRGVGSGRWVTKVYAEEALLSELALAGS